MLIWMGTRFTTQGFNHPLDNPSKLIQTGNSLLRLQLPSEHRHTTTVASEFVKLFCGGRVSDLPFSDKVLEAYQTGWEK